MQPCDGIMSEYQVKECGIFWLPSQVASMPLVFGRIVPLALLALFGWVRRKCANDTWAKTCRGPVRGPYPRAATAVRSLCSPSRLFLPRRPGISHNRLFCAPGISAGPRRTSKGSARPVAFRALYALSTGSRRACCLARLARSGAARPLPLSRCRSGAKRPSRHRAPGRSPGFFARAVCALSRSVPLAAPAVPSLAVICGAGSLIGRPSSVPVRVGSLRGSPVPPCPVPFGASGPAAPPPGAAAAVAAFFCLCPRGFLCSRAAPAALCAVCQPARDSVATLCR